MLRKSADRMVRKPLPSAVAPALGNQPSLHDHALDRSARGREVPRMRGAGDVDIPCGIDRYAFHLPEAGRGDVGSQKQFARGTDLARIDRRAMRPPEKTGCRTPAVVGMFVESVEVEA